MSMRFPPWSNKCAKQWAASRSPLTHSLDTILTITEIHSVGVEGESPGQSFLKAKATWSGAGLHRASGRSFINQLGSYPPTAR